jgi:hypothetical protein
MSEKSLVEQLAENAAVYMFATKLDGRLKNWRVVTIPLAVEVTVIRAHANSLEDPDAPNILGRGLEALGVSRDYRFTMYWPGYTFRDGIDSHGRDAKRMWSQIAAAVQYRLENDPQYLQLRKLDDYRAEKRDEIIAAHDNQFAPP